MTDIATLGYEVDSSGLVQATHALDQNAAAAAKVQTLTGKVEESYAKMVKEVSASGQAVASASTSWQQFVSDRIEGYRQIEGSHKSAMQKISAEWQQHKQEQAAIQAEAIVRILEEIQQRERAWDIVRGQFAEERRLSEMRANAEAAFSKQMADEAIAEAQRRTAAEASEYEKRWSMIRQQFAEEQRLAEMRANAEAAFGSEDFMPHGEDRFKQLARSAMEYAETMREANLSERAMAEAAQEATSAFTAREAVLASVGSEQERMAERVRAMEEAEARATAQQEKAARAAQIQELNLKQLLGQIDPTVAALDRLADMEERLEKARDLGALKPEVYEQYQAKIDEMRSSTLNAGKASDVMTRSIGKLNLEAVQTQQSIASLVRALATGNFSQAQSSIMSLTARTGAMGAAFTGAGIAVTGTGAALLGFTVLAAKGHIESRKIEGVIIGMGSAAGLSTGQILDMRNEIGRVSGSYKDATQAINQLTLSGTASGEMFQSLASSAVDASRLTGQSIGSVTSEFETLAQDGGDALIRLNNKYKFLTLETYKHIEALREQKGDFEANKFAAEELERVMANRAQQMVDSAGYVETAWKGVVNVFNAAIQAAKDWGRTDLDAKIGRLQSEIQSASVSRDGIVRETAYTKQLREQLAALQEQKRAHDANAEAQAKGGKAQADAIAAEAEAEKLRDQANDSINRRLEGLDKESSKLAARNRIIEEYNRLSDNDPRHFDGSMERLLAASDKQIEDRFSRGGGARSPGRSGGKTDEEKALERLLKAYESADEALARQIWMFGKTGEAAKMAYETAHGSLAGLTEGQKAWLVEQAKTLDQLEAERKLAKELADKDARRIEAFEEVIGALRDELQLVGMSADQQEIWNNTVGIGIDKESLLGKEIIETTQELQRQRDTMADQIEAMDSIRGAGKDLFRDIRDGVGVWDAVGNAIDKVADKLFDLAAENIMDQIFGKSGDPAGGSAGGWFGSLLGAFFGGGRAWGGDIRGDRMYRVGEFNRPELLNLGRGQQYLIPGDQGRVEPMRPEGRGRGSTTIHMTVPIQGYVKRDTPAQIATETLRVQRLQTSRNG